MKVVVKIRHLLTAAVAALAILAAMSCGAAATPPSDSTPVVEDDSVVPASVGDIQSDGAYNKAIQDIGASDYIITMVCFGLADYTYDYWTYVDSLNFRLPEYKDVTETAKKIWDIFEGDNHGGRERVYAFCQEHQERPYREAKERMKQAQLAIKAEDVYRIDSLLEELVETLNRTNNIGFISPDVSREDCDYTMDTREQIVNAALAVEAWNKQYPKNAYIRASFQSSWIESSGEHYLWVLEECKTQHPHHYTD